LKNKATEPLRDMWGYNKRPNIPVNRILAGKKKGWA
jgi:hypothetical protein